MAQPYSRSGQPEDLHDTLRRVVGRPPADNAHAPRPTQPLRYEGAAGNRNHRPEYVVERRLRDSVIFKAFGDAATKLSTPARAAIRDDDELMPFIQLSSMNDNGGIIFTDGPKRGYFPDEGVFVSAGHLGPSRDGDGGKIYVPNYVRPLRWISVSKTK